MESCGINRWKQLLPCLASHGHCCGTVWALQPVVNLIVERASASKWGPESPEKLLSSGKWEPQSAAVWKERLRSVAELLLLSWNSRRG